MKTKQYSVRLFVTSNLGQDLGVVLDKPQSHYIATVMRRAAGERIALFNGRDGEWLGVLQEVHKNHCLVHVTEQLRSQEEEPDIHLLFAPVKKIQTNMIVQKATELGVAEIHPVLTRRTNSERLKKDKLELQALEAAEQCERLNLPIIHDAVKLDDAIKLLAPDRLLIFCDERRSGNAALDILPQFKDYRKWSMITGPEGGFTEEESKFISARENTVAISLGRRILRAETAVIAGLSLLQATCGDW
ncbi:16S rRNA (uracil(1498)-N(3))-methyltransferase [Sneathiella marina]|uniref:Ribosomal RNA small subunit methyltransferase E n=1 Tax=Sneathiella marina TaxID=2950108 RepID=A0ABY4W4N8_9PROT|nr:16S rRNA (uracil(1498)-N(3))-methyltransferase [Sneathiella marina]USG62157.1 16S rRNA (uracil(1498)-N(3))-methyltransferase [Sneathiella marina]